MDMHLDSTTNDISFDAKGHLRQVTEPGDLVRQRLLIRLQMHRGEWSLNTDAYVDWDLIIESKSRLVVDAHFKSIIESTEGVAKVLRYGSRVTGRHYTASFEVLASSSEVITGTIGPPLVSTDPGELDGAINALLSITLL